MTTLHLTQLPDDLTRTELATDAVASVAELVTHAVNCLPVDTRKRFHALLNSGARLTVNFTLQQGAATITANFEEIPFFTVQLGSGKEEETRH